MILKFLEILLGLIFFAFLASQVFIPSFKGLPVFPMFRKENALRGKMKDVKQELKEQGIEKQLNKLNQKKGGN